jgi:hypothetical protein
MRNPSLFIRNIREIFGCGLAALRSLAANAFSWPECVISLLTAIQPDCGELRWEIIFASGFH